MSKILEKINGPSDLNDLGEDDMIKLAAEVRELIIETVSRNGGHLAANLGVVELTIALLKVFSPPSDKLVWDVGHQSYAYKILTGRRDKFSTLRQMGGISGFLKREESEYDVFGAGHSGTAISAALGIAAARDLRGSDEHVVAILGDGAAGCGVSLEGFNNVAHTTRRFIVVLNDNEMSIAANVGAMSRYLGSKLASPRYNRVKKSIENAARKMRMGWMRSAYYRVEEALKGLFLRSVIFEEFGLRYVGPIDGHNMHALLDAMTIARDSDRPILLHVSTEKGKGYKFAESHPEKWHGTSGFNISSGEPLLPAGNMTYSAVFGSVLERLAEQNDKIAAITAAMPAGTGLSGFAQKYPARFFDVGIAEEHAAVFAAGLAAEGMVPVFAVYSTFLQRSIDCVIHDICLQKLPVVICADRAGVVGDDGPTHHGVFDIVLLRPLPNLVIMQPRDEAELANMLYTAVELGKPVVIRYPRGAGTGAPVPDNLQKVPEGKAEVLADPEPGQGKIVWIWALGDMVGPAQETAAILKDKGVHAGVVNARFVKPLDRALLEKHAGKAGMIVTMENGIVTGGFGSAVEETLIESGWRGKTLKFGWPDEFIQHGAEDDLRREYGLVPAHMAETVLSRL